MCHRHLSNILPRGHDYLHQRQGLNLDSLLETDGHHGSLDLLRLGFVESQVETVVGERANLGVLAVVADTDNRNLGVFDHGYQLLGKIEKTVVKD